MRYLHLLAFLSSFEVNDVDVLVGTDTGGFEGFRGNLLVFTGDHVDAKREVVNAGLLTTQVEDTDLGVGDTTVEPGFRVRLDEDRKSVV